VEGCGALAQYQLQMNVIIAQYFHNAINTQPWIHGQWNRSLQLLCEWKRIAARERHFVGSPALNALWNPLLLQQFLASCKLPFCMSLDD